MLKRLVIFAVLVLGFTSAAHSKSSGQNQKGKAQDEPSPAVTIIDNSTRRTQADSSAQKAPESHAEIEYSNWALVLVGALGVAAAVATLLQIERQTKTGVDAAKAAKDGAQAALNQAKAMMASERAWIAIRSSMDGYIPGVGDDLRYWWILENAGKTPARIIETQCMYELIQPEELTNLPSVPNYPEPIKLSGFLLSPGAKEDYHTFLRTGGDGRPVKKGEIDGEIIRGVEWEMMYLRVYGYVRYFDGMSDDPKESRFCDYYVWPLSTRPPRATGFRHLLGVPSEYTKSN